MNASSSGGATPLAAIGLIVTALLWGAMIPMTHALATRHLDPFFVSAIRYLIPAPLLLAMSVAFDGASPFRAPLPWPKVFLLGGGMASFSVFYTIGIMLSEPVRAAIAMSCSPLIAAIMTKIMIRVPLARGFWPAAIAAMIGATLVALDAVRPKAGSPGDHGYLGEMLLVIAMMSWSWYSIKVQFWLGPLGWSQMRITFLTSLCGGILICGLFAVLAWFDPLRIPSEMPSSAAIAMLAWVGIGGAGLAILFWNYGVSHVGVPVATLYTSLAPVFSVLVAALFFGSTVTLQQIAGGIIILAGVVRMQWLQARMARQQAAP
ncbi:DMT family transporter [uncultured Ferrovibrio sp.]|uniref:DMT family transporter n=1 Tax=uncultured Ferrovibrio sp. TaxID=1576913 RepID=UPI0026219844|nr:DMT family transporter [uncultured Ferrovibrio sp.]